VAGYATYLTPRLFARRRFRQERLRGYIVREHRRGRPVSEILDDTYVRRFASASILWRVLCDPVTISQLEQNDLEAIRACCP
jgi:hypothetical protein